MRPNAVRPALRPTRFTLIVAAAFTAVAAALSAGAASPVPPIRADGGTITPVTAPTPLPSPTVTRDSHHW